LRQIRISDTAANFLVFFPYLPAGHLIHATMVNIAKAYTVAMAVHDNPGAMKGDLQNYTYLLDNEAEGANINVIWDGYIPIIQGQGVGVTFRVVSIGDQVEVTLLVELDE